MTFKKSSLKSQNTLRAMAKYAETQVDEARDQTTAGVAYGLDDRQRFAADLDSLFESALTEGNYTAALKAKELSGKARGFLTPKPKNDTISLDSLSDDQLMELIEKLQASALPLI